MATWFAFKGLNNGQAIELAGVQEKIAVSWGFHGYATQQQAQSQPNSVNIVTKLEANALIADYQAALTQGAQPGGPNASNPIAGGAQGLANGVFSEFINFLKDNNLWTRIGEVIVGGMLIYVGLRATTSTSATGAGRSATKKVIKTTGKVIKK